MLVDSPVHLLKYILIDVAVGLFFGSLVDGGRLEMPREVRQT